MKINRFVLIIAASLGLAAANPVLAATARYSWVVQNVYNYNHPFAAQLPTELQSKMQKMASSSFSFYRGTAHLFYQDMNTLPASAYTDYATSQTWLNGDMHLLNIGGLKDANGNYVYDTNDFDENYWGQYVWDLRRMAVSIILAAKENGLSTSNQQQLVLDFLDMYATKMSDFHGNDDELSYRLTTSNTSGVVKDTIQKSSTQTRADLLAKYTVVSGNRTFQTTSELQTVTSTVYNNVVTAVANYISSIAPSKRYANSYYTVKDVRLKLSSGIGSLGRYRYYVLVEGPSSSTSDDVILQMKQEVASVVATTAPGNMPSYVYESNEGERVAKSMKANLTNTDVLDGWTTMAGLQYQLREKSPYDVDFDYTQLTSYSSFSTAVQYAAKIVAKNHAVSDKDYDETLIPYGIDKETDDLISGHKSAFKTEILNFAIDYANQVGLDYASFVSAYNNGVPLY
jgi:uncharacterized protein (DUF2252 family)